VGKGAGMAECEKRGEVLPGKTKIICLVTGMNIVHAEHAKKTQRALRIHPLRALPVRPLSSGRACPNGVVLEDPSEWCRPGGRIYLSGLCVNKMFFARSIKNFCHLCV
jgi:hypothetical protein